VDGKWESYKERTAYESDWLKVSLYDVKLPDKTEIEGYHIVRSGAGGVGVVVHDPAKGVLLIWRHRLVGDEWGWEIPGGRIDEGEKPEDAGAREVLEETGWRPGKLSPLLNCQPLNGFVDHRYHFFTAKEATWEGPSADVNEAADIAWIDLPQLRGKIMPQGEIRDGFSITALLWAMTFGPLADA